MVCHSCIFCLVCLDRDIICMNLDFIFFNCWRGQVGDKLCKMICLFSGKATDGIL